MNRKVKNMVSLIASYYEGGIPLMNGGFRLIGSNDISEAIKSMGPLLDVTYAILNDKDNAFECFCYISDFLEQNHKLAPMNREILFAQADHFVTSIKTN